MEAILYDKQGNIIKDHTKAIGVLFEGNDAVESNVIIKNDEQEDRDHVHIEDIDKSMYHCVMGKSNISIFIDKHEKIFNLISRSDLADGKSIGTSVSFIDEDFDKFLALMQTVNDPKFGTDMNY